MMVNENFTMKTFRELFNTILASDKEISRKVAREVRKLVYSSGDGSKYKQITSIVEKAPVEYKKITEDWRQDNFVMAISVMYFLGNKRDNPDFFFPWFFKLLQHENGNIRHAAVRMIEIELGPLTVHLRVPDWKTTHPEYSEEQASRILFELYVNLNNIAANFWKPVYKRYKYIDSLPTGQYKSVQMVLARLFELCGEEYFNKMNTRYHSTN